MSTVVSRDGTRIAFDRTGTGPALIVVDGALCHRGMGPSGDLALALAPHFTVYTYDRRGRGESGDTLPYDVQREIEDLSAVLAEAGGSAARYGASSGAALVLDAASQLDGLTSIVLFEAPFVVDDSRAAITDTWTDIDEAVAGGERGRAVKLFLRAVGMPSFVLAIMPLLPVWRKLESVAHTLPYDGQLVKEHQRGTPLPRDRWAAVSVPALGLDGGKRPIWMRHAMEIG